MNSIMNKAMISFDRYQCDFRFDWQDQDAFVLHANTGNCLIV